MLKRIQVKYKQNSSKKNHKMIEDKVIEQLMAKQFAKSKSKKYYKHQLMISQQKKREKKKKHHQEEITEIKNKA
ncbi:uncharacterized protein CIMG_13139 [Coccidioides immitis RS]|uniref:Uncharacterized protein n=1 Tax=Coccidioides immitis (strain RS) TaxID=246410 RepID=A0A0D8JTT9_COCIM|nr:uncharacterized protein CIMG_13139 [Coccidioides immitis RS]KJF60697.1 hypothetical protein CIMG_13139 [Coccidioides immitis RS]